MTDLQTVAACVGICAAMSAMVNTWFGHRVRVEARKLHEHLDALMAAKPKTDR